MKKLGIVRFPGTNCDRDTWQAAKEVGLTPEWLWYEDSFNWQDYAAFVVPGGFSYGDYLRCGAMAAKSPVMCSLKEAVENGKPVLGICNGFQILCEARLLPGTLMHNKKGKFRDKFVELNVQSDLSTWSQKLKSKLRLPIAHGEGNYFIDDQGLQELKNNNQIWLTYTDNPNGSVADIAGVTNEQGNVAGLMPHPERALWDWMGSTDGKEFFSWI